MKSTHILFFISALAITGCSPKYYVPNTQNVPAIGGKGQVNFTLAANSNQTELQAAVGITDKLAIQLNGGYVPQKNSNGNSGTGKLIEGGLGYYHNFNDKWLFDTYLLAGGGTVENSFPSTVSDNPRTNGNISANLFRMGIQPGLTFRKRYFSMTGSARVSSLNYWDIDGNLVFEGDNQQTYLRNNNSNFLIEPALTLRTGFERLKFQLQIMRSFNLTNPGFKQDNTLVSVGLNLHFGGRGRVESTAPVRN